MFTGKILTKMASHGLTFGEHCVDLVPYSRKPFKKTRNLENTLKLESLSDHQGTYTRKARARVPPCGVLKKN
jgi:hypothetical protein